MSKLSQSEAEQVLADAIVFIEQTLADKNAALAQAAEALASVEPLTAELQSAKAAVEAASVEDEAIDNKILALKEVFAPTAPVEPKPEDEDIGIPTEPIIPTPVPET